MIMSRFLASFVHQIKSKYYGGNQYVSIEVIVLDHLSATTYPETESALESRTLHSVLHSFLSDFSKQDADTIAVHKGLVIGFLKQKQIMSSKLSTLL